MSESDGLARVAAQYGADGDVLAAVMAELARVADRPLGAAQLAPFDQLHTRGLASTVELAQLAGVVRGSTILDVGAGLGGPARWLAETFDARVDGIDAIDDLVQIAGAITQRWAGDPGRVTFRAGDALALGVADGSYDLVWMQHVAMNIPDRDGLYREIRRALRPGGRFATYDVVCGDGDLRYPTPWAREAAASTVVSAGQTRDAIARAGLRVVASTDDTPAAIAWARGLLDAAAAGGPAPGGPMLQALFGASARERVRNLALNVVEGRARVAAVIAEA